MDLSTIRPGDRVDITLRGARVVAVEAPANATGELLVTTSAASRIRIPVPWPDITIDRVAPAEWPPRPGDLWRSAPRKWAPSGRLWLAGPETDDDGTVDSYVPIRSDLGDLIEPEDLLSGHGPMTLVHREPEAGDA